MNGRKYNPVLRLFTAAEGMTFTCIYAMLNPKLKCECQIMIIEAISDIYSCKQIERLSTANNEMKFAYVYAMSTPKFR